MTALGERLREAAVVVSTDELDSLGSAIGKLASANASLADQLARLRLSFALDIDPDAISRFDEQLERVGITLQSRDVQRRRVMAMCVLTARFERSPGRRSTASLAADTAPALAAIVLARSGRRPVHPDLVSWGRYWLGVVAPHLRRSTRLATPPVFESRPPTIAPEATPTQAAQAAVGTLQEALGEYVKDVMEWGSDLDPALVSAQGEQLDILWWLQAARPDISPERAAVTAATQLAELTRRVPGPPGSRELLARWLEPWRKAKIKISELTDIPDGAAPQPQEIFPLLTRTVDRPRELPVVDVAEWLLEELQLARIIKEHA